MENERRPDDGNVDEPRRGGGGREDRWAILLIAGGLLLLAGNLGWFAWVGSWLWALLFLGGGAAFIYHYSTDRKQWWALIPGFTLAGIGLTILLGDAGGPVFLGMIGLAFLVVHLTSRERWWAAIPAGVLLTLAVVALVDELRPGADTGWLFFLGLGATFGYLYMRPDEGERQPWALFPALAALALALFTFVGTSFGGVVVPLALIAIGGYLIWRQSGRSDTQTSAPGPTPPREQPAPSPELPAPPTAPEQPAPQQDLPAPSTEPEQRAQLGEDDE